MKKISMAVAAGLALLLGNNVMAESTAATPTYVSAALGGAEFDTDCLGAPSCDKSSTGGRLVGGYELGHGLSAELGYAWFGKAKGSGNGAELTARASGLTLGAAYRFEVLPRMELLARAGVIGMRTKVDGSDGAGLSASDSDTKAQFYAGLGLGCVVAPGLRVELAADFSRAEYETFKADVRLLSLGVRYHF
ncbi:MAG TPA: outer membrane beta-barrel protein [Ideonella sp.]|uniref:outer membrane beta-barrel protein n=1 Tax=Ideonella sp. TaxID=1929293 RepID=UPI002BE4F01D|nr:outer membrane beta-barrel protein [Ideonella sp.]HSI52118.1 outer membrane beta-barrel protein [Ideonella sp.]